MYWTYKYWIDKYNKKLSKAYIRMRLIFKCGLYSNWLIFKCGFYFDCTYFLLKSRQKSNVVIFATFEMMFHSFKIEATSRRLKNIVFFDAFCKLSIYSKLIWDTYRLKLSILFPKDVKQIFLPWNWKMVLWILPAYIQLFWDCTDGL